MKIETLLFTNPGHSAPEEVIAAILKGNPTAFGFAVQDTGGETPELSIAHESTTPSVEQVMEFQKNAHDFRAQLYFGQLGSKFNPEDIGPYVIKDDNDTPFLTIGLDGDFSKHVDLRSGRTDSFNFAKAVIIPVVLELCNKTEGDLPKIMTALNDARFSKDFLSHVGHRGVLSILPVDGEQLWITSPNEELGGKFDWGYASNLHSSLKKIVAEPAPAKSRFSFGAKKTEASPPPLPPTETKTVDKPKGSVPEVKANGENLPQPIKCPDWVHKNDDKETWYLMVAGMKPDRWKNKVPVLPVIPLDKLPKDLADLMQWKADDLKAKLKGGSAVQATAVEGVHQIKTETATGAAPKSGGEIAEQRHLISAPDMDKILDHITKFADSSGNQMMSLEEIIKIEEKLGDFSAQIASTPAELSNWKPSQLFSLGKLDYRAIVLYALEFRKLWRNTQKLEDLVGTGSGEKVVTTKTQLTPGTTKTESIVTGHKLAKEELKPAPKKAGFSFGKKVA